MSEPIIRPISQRAYLSEMALMMTTQMSKLIIQTGNKAISEETTQSIANRILSLPKYANQKPLMDQVVEKANDYYSKAKLPKPSPNQDKEDAYQRLIAQSEIALLRSCDFQVIRLTRDQIPPFIQLDKSLEDLSCFEYAFMRAGVEKAFPALWSRNDLLGLLDEWGFAPVREEESKPSDLVLFLKENIPCHMGIRYRKQILSKPGNRSRYAYIHKLEEALSFYGNQVLFFRRKLLKSE